MKNLPTYWSFLLEVQYAYLKLLPPKVLCHHHALYSLIYPHGIQFQKYKIKSKNHIEKKKRVKLVSLNSFTSAPCHFRNLRSIIPFPFMSLFAFFFLLDMWSSTFTRFFGDFSFEASFNKDSWPFSLRTASFSLSGNWVVLCTDDSSWWI